MKYYYRYMTKQEILRRPKKVIHRACIDSYYARRNGKSNLRVDLRENKVLQLCTQKTWEF